MVVDGAAEPASEKSQPWWATDPEIAAINRAVIEEFVQPQPQPQPQPLTPAPTEPDPVLVDVLSGASARRLGEARDDLHRAKRRYADAIGAARAAGLSWGEIGQVLGVSRQSLHRRFGDVGLLD